MLTSLVLTDLSCLAYTGLMLTASSRSPDTNQSYAHEVIAYAERFACPDLRSGSLTDAPAGWQSRYLDLDCQRLSPIAALLPFWNQRPLNTAYLSLTDREAVVALRILLVASGITIGQLRAGLKKEHFPPFTSAVKAFVRSSIQIHHSAAGNWLPQAIQILQRHKPQLLIIEGLQFGHTSSGKSALVQSFGLIHRAAASQTGLLLFD